MEKIQHHFPLLKIPIQCGYVREALVLVAHGETAEREGLDSKKEGKVSESRAGAPLKYSHAPKVQWVSRGERPELSVENLTLPIHPFSALHAEGRGNWKMLFSEESGEPKMKDPSTLLQEMAPGKRQPDGSVLDLGPGCNCKHWVVILL